VTKSDIVDELRAERFRSGLLGWADGNLREFPWRDSEASFFEVFVAEFFLTQTPAENVGRVYPQFISEFPSLEAIRRSDHESLVEVIEPLGFYNMRSEALSEIAATHDTLPTDEGELRELPRVGDYVANATVCFALDRQVPILDRNVERVYDRVFGDEWPDSPSEQLEFAADILPEEEARTYNLALLDFGAAICTPTPKCSECFATELCEYYDSEIAEPDPR
jgi:A/G-specific adenine glycosylase